MMGRTHIVSAQVAWLVAAPHYLDDTWKLVAGTVVAGLAALGPDLDHGGSTASRLLFWLPDGLNRVGHVLFRVRRRRLGDRIGQLLGGHRQGAHSLLSIVAVFWLSMLTLLLPWLGGLWLPFAITLGWAAHIAGDCLTQHGVGLLWPYTRRRYKLASINTGGGVELALRAVLNFAAVVLILNLAGVDLATVARLAQPLTQ